MGISLIDSFTHSSIFIWTQKSPQTAYVVLNLSVLAGLDLLFWQRRGGFSYRPTQSLFVREDALLRSLSPGGETCPLLYNLRGSVEETIELNQKRDKANIHRTNKHGEDHFPASYGGEAWERARWRQDHYTSGSREFAHFVFLSFMAFVLCLSAV